MKVSRVPNIELNQIQKDIIKELEGEWGWIYPDKEEIHYPNYFYDREPYALLRVDEDGVIFGRDPTFNIDIGDIKGLDIVSMDKAKQIIVQELKIRKLLNFK